MHQIVVFVLDSLCGLPACGIGVTLQRQSNDLTWLTVARGRTNSKGCINDFVEVDSVLPVGKFRLIYETGEYYSRQSIETLYPEIIVDFFLANDEQYVLPLLLGPYSYSTYRGN